MVALTAKKNDPEDLAENTARSALLLSGLGGLKRTSRPFFRAKIYFIKLSFPFALENYFLFSLNNGHFSR
jgi:hypothetical protein